jgi:hypothetical protein
LGELAASAELDLVQLDYARPRTAAVSGPGPAELPAFAPSFVHAVRALRKTLYLEPQLCVVASAGWADTYACVENAAAVLREAGCGAQPISAVRGSNLLPILDDLAAAGIELDNVETGAPWSELPGVAVQPPRLHCVSMGGRGAIGIRWPAPRRRPGRPSGRRIVVLSGSLLPSAASGDSASSYTPRETPPSSFLAAAIWATARS